MATETWTISNEEQRRIEAFEMWCYRRILKTSWTDMVTNDEVLERMSERRTLWSSVKKMGNEWIGHVLRHGGFLGIILEGCVEGKNARGRPRTKYMRQIIKDQGCNSYGETKRKAEGGVRNCYKPISGLNTKEGERRVPDETANRYSVWHFCFALDKYVVLV